MRRSLNLLIWATLANALPLFSQYNGAATGIPSGNYWHGTERRLRYTPDGEDFVIVNGERRFNRALYGTNTGFRVEAGDQPEFGVYMPNMGGNMQLGILCGNQSRWLRDMQHVEFRYRPGSAIYTITDPMLDGGTLRLHLIPMAAAEGFVLKVEGEGMPSDADLFWSYGGANNKRFSREGDLGVDPADCFELKPEYCRNNIFNIRKGGFDLYYGSVAQLVRDAANGIAVEADNKKRPRKLTAVFPENTQTSLASPYHVTTPADMWESDSTDNQPLFVGRTPISATVQYLAIAEGFANGSIEYSSLPSVFLEAEHKRAQTASRVRISTPDPYFNTVGGALAIAADGIWEEPAWLHGAIGWRMPLSGWRAAYTGDVLGWHDRARIHFDAYAASQVTDVEPVIAHPAQDPAKSMARAEKRWGTQMYSNGYISRNPNRNNMMHHYDMNLCYIDELLWHFNWTGDMDYVRKMWPVLERHLEWEKRNFDPNDDGLYDAYCCIWASDALQYNSGGVTHSSAYNYRANKMAALIAGKIGVDPKPYEKEAEKILNAINSNLWLPSKGHWAEYKDIMGYGLAHESAALWTIYHAIDSDIHTPFQAYQATRYVDNSIPHIPVRARGLKDEGYATVSTTNWFPYSWSINNVAFAEVAHTALAYWQSGRSEEAFKLLKSSFLDGMYLGASPGNFGQISFYDATRGECYRDFGDPVGITSRTLVQGLYGIKPDLMNNRMVFEPGFPPDWEHASIETSELKFAFSRDSRIDRYEIRLSQSKQSDLSLIVPAPYDKIDGVTVNGKSVKWKLVSDVIDMPKVVIEVPESSHADVRISWGGNKISTTRYSLSSRIGERFELTTQGRLLSYKDEQKVISGHRVSGHSISGEIKGEPGHRTMFVQIKQGDMVWWEPVHIEVKAEDRTPSPRHVLADIGKGDDLSKLNFEVISLSDHFNSSVCDIFSNRYESPRSPFTTLQIPLQGIGEWCHPDMNADIDDSGLRAASKEGIFTTPFGLPFAIDAGRRNNIVYTSLFDNYPDHVEIPLNGKSKRAYLLMAGSTNHMQVHFVNGKVVVDYTDGTSQVMELINPSTWCPIEQDFYFDDHAFKFEGKKPYRVSLKDGSVSRDLATDMKLYKSDNRKIPGGAAVILDLPLDKGKELKSLRLETRANEVVIGLMGVTLER